MFIGLATSACMVSNLAPYFVVLLVTDIKHMIQHKTGHARNNNKLYNIDRVKYPVLIESESAFNKVYC